MPLTSQTSVHRFGFLRAARPLWLLLGGWVVGTAVQAQGIFTCIDSSGRRITSDRPIKECLDREQHELGASGTVRKVHPPSYTAEERARIAAQRKAEEAQEAQIREERRRERALLIRYPNQSVHDKERAEALAQVDEVMSAVKKREDTLLVQRKQIDNELEFYQGDRDKAPSWLKRKIEDNEQQVQVQKRFLDEQLKEKERINARFDEELAKLRQLWKQNNSSTATLPR